MKNGEKRGRGEPLGGGGSEGATGESRSKAEAGGRGNQTEARERERFQVGGDVGDPRRGSPPW